jgi:hypothetical protein
LVAEGVREGKVRHLLLTVAELMLELKNELGVVWVGSTLVVEPVVAFVDKSAPFRLFRSAENWF